MNATELIKQIAALPPQERIVFEQLFEAMVKGTAGQPSKWPDFAERLHSIYGDKVAPDSHHIIDEGRGDK